MQIINISPPTPPKTPKSPHKQFVEAIKYIFTYLFSLAVYSLYYLVSKPKVMIPLLLFALVTVTAYTYGLQDANPTTIYIYRNHQGDLQEIPIQSKEHLEVVESLIPPDNLVIAEDMFEAIISERTQIFKRDCTNVIASNRTLFKQIEKDFKIPAAIVAAQFLLESRSGTSKLAKNANNFFGIKYTAKIKKFCKKDAKNNVIVMRAHDDCCQTKKCKNPDKFAVFKTPEDCFRAYGNFLKGKRYKKLYNNLNYEDWAHGLKKAGYATDPNYATSLINIIQKYKLDQL